MIHCGQTATKTYDKLGNRESVNMRDGTDQDYAVNELTNRYDDDQGEDIVCEYDDAGNTTVDPNGYQYTYDYENRLIEIKEKEQAEHLAELRGEYTKAEWGSQIRSYVLHPYQMVKDHRTDRETGNVQAVLDGRLDEFMGSYLRSQMGDGNID